MSFVHLHVHSHYSLLDGLGTPKDLVKLAKAQGAPAVALTDHGYLYGAIEFYKAAKEAEINPIVGCEVYLTSGSRFDRTGTSEARYFHLILLAKDYEGYQNLMYLVSYASLEGFYYKPRIDFDLLKDHSKGLIALSGCLAGELAGAVAEEDEAKQLKVIEKYKATFGPENYYLEIQDHPEIPEQGILNKRLIELSKITNTELVATQDSHYLHKTDAYAQDILLCIQTQTNVHETNRMKFTGDFSMLSAQEMMQKFSSVPSAITNTLAIAEKCNLKLTFGHNLIPKFETPEHLDSAAYLRQICEEGLKKLYEVSEREKAQKQLDYELSVVHRMGFDDYFLIVHDFVKYAKDIGIAVGPGRGSAAGSIIAFTMNITELDPLRYGLIFERFLNPERISMPDIDIDFADTRRGEVIDYVVKKYGRDRVAQIITFGTMAAKAAVRDVGRGLGYSYADVDQVSKLMPPPVLGKHNPLKDSIKNEIELKREYENNPKAKEILDNAIKLEGTVRHAGTHASAVVISSEPLTNYTPLQKGTSADSELISQYSMKPLEDLGLLKMDFLGLKNLTIIENALILIKQTHDVTIDLPNISIEDPKTFDLLQKGDTLGVFQLESSGMRRYIRELKPTEFPDIIAMISLYRPGPMEWIPDYIKGKHAPETVKYPGPLFEPILKETYGVAIYQEQILQIARQFSGFSLGEADLLRKAVGKKDPKLLVEQKEKFIEGAIKEGHKKDFAKEIFEKVVEPFAGYGFNKAHAACYAMISYRTAYLKAHYPVEFMAAMLTCDQSNTERVALEIQECEDIGIAVLPPSINESFASFTVVNGKTIRFGLAAIKGIGEGPIDEILKVRRATGVFKSIEDLASRVPPKLMNKKTIESLALSGALDELGDRQTIAQNYEAISKYAKNSQGGNEPKKDTDQIDMFGDIEYEKPPLEALKLIQAAPQTLMDRLNGEKLYLGMYVSSHPLKGLGQYFKKRVTLMSAITPKMIDKRIKIGGLMTKMKKVMTKSGAYMAYIEIEDPTGKMEVTVFPRTFDRFQAYLKESQVLILDGKPVNRRDGIQFNCEEIKAVSLETMIKNAKDQGLFDEKERLVKKNQHVEFHDESKPSENQPPQTTSNTFKIKIPSNFNPQSFVELRNLLKNYPGEQKVELQIDNNGIMQSVPTAMTVTPSEALEIELKKLLANN